MSHAARQLTKIGVFYDGNYFDRVSKYYNHQHEKKAWISVSGLHDYIRYSVSENENVDVRSCQVIDAHYFRGRFSAQKSSEKALFNERVVDDMLMRENVTAHYLPMNFVGKEKGVDVWLALEAFELAIYKQFDVVVLIASDGDYIPLARKLKTLGIRVMTVSWFFTFETASGEIKVARPSQMLLKEVNYSIAMSEVIDRMDNTSGDERIVLSGLFQRRRDGRLPSGAAEADWKLGFIEVLKETYGLIRPEIGLKNMFFPYTALTDIDPDELEEGMEVSYQEGVGQKGPFARKVRTN
ncbi:hypothetical protein NOV72_01438 [Caballeronia novacaledonica]|uniref:NYN domain protein n=1 Tax=Caballeronia novacaledonica TaxID=1544861 RepID=A0A2U3I263_9BURK|nr:NYN domain-containing protein [Caballeronia novacaledonica]SPB14189.1 hypothetical protein NOV72_01438 [Caballeronia novacaledonica]